MHNRFYRLIEAIRDTYHCEAEWLRSEYVEETWRGQTVWEGDVQIFAIKGHPEADLVYAWSYETAQEEEHIMTVLQLPPVISAADAVRVAVVDRNRDS